MRGPAWTVEQDAELRRRWAARESFPAIAAALGRTRVACQRRADALGLRRYRRTTAAVRAEIARRVGAGETDNSVAAALGVAPGTVRLVRRGVGLPALSPTERNRKGAARRRAGRGSPHAPTPAQARVLALLAGGPLPSAEVARRYGRGGPTTVRILLARLRRKGQALCEGRNGPGGARWLSLNWWLENNAGLIWRTAHKVCRRHRQLDPEDVASVARLAVARCVPTFRPRGVKFSTYAVPSAERAAWEYAARELAGGVHVAVHRLFDKAAAPAVSSLDALADEMGCGADTLAPEPDRAGPPADPAFWEKAAAGLPPVLGRLLVGHYRDGLTYSQLGAEIGKSRGRVEQLMRDAEARVRMSGALDDYDAA